jgi:glycosyltransferase involved in cell wall biosynthesis
VGSPADAEAKMNLPMPDAGSRPDVPVQLSVIIPTLHRLETARLLAERIRGLLPALSIEVIVVSPGAGNETSADGLVRHVSDTSHGVYAAYNAGLRSCSGEYVWFIGDDDYPLDAAADIGYMVQTGAFDLLIAPVLFSSGRIYRPSRSLLLLHFLNWCQQGVIYRRRELERRRFFLGLRVQADQYVNILLRADPAVRKKYLTKPICMFGVDGVSGRARDTRYRNLRPALAHRTLGCGAFLAFRVLTVLEPLIKQVMKVR